MRFAHALSSIALASVLLVDCASPPVMTPQVELGVCDEMKSGDFSGVAASAPPTIKAQVTGFLDAAYKLEKAASDQEATLMASCAELGKAIGLGDADLTATPGGGKGAETVCNNVATRIGALVKANKDAELAVSIEAPRCTVDVAALDTCFTTCGSKPKTEDAKASCQGGDVTGTCDGDCLGTCVVEANGACSGACQGTCNGKCESGFSGTCGGKCTGTCDGKKSTGKCKGTCAGKCDGKSEGACGGVCTGACSAACETKAHGKCEGLCAGGCSGAVKDPACTGDYRPPGVDPGCQASCGAAGALAAKCDLPRVRVSAKGKVNDDTKKLVAALQASLPKIASVQYGAGVKLGVGLGTVTKGAADVRDAASKASAKATACVNSAGTTASEASGAMRIDVQASGSVTSAVNATVSSKGG